MTVSVHGTDNVDLEAWRPSTLSVFEHGAAAKRDIVAASAKTGTATDTVPIKNTAKTGAFYYADVFPGPTVGDAIYT